MINAVNHAMPYALCGILFIVVMQYLIDRKGV
jgi:hypothetical protein